MRKQIVRGHLDMLVLSVVADGPAYGWAVVDALKQRSDGAFDLPEGTVYPALYRLENSGLLASEWIDIKNRRRRVYRLTTAGKRALARQRSEWSAFADAVGAVLNRRKPWPAT